MKNMDMLEIGKNEETARIARIPAKTRRKVKRFLNEGGSQLSF